MRRKVRFIWTYGASTGGRIASHGYPREANITLTPVEGGRKDWYCVVCGRVIPAGVPHFNDPNGTARLHIACTDGPPIAS